MSDLALEGIRVIDLTHAWSGPHCTRLLADYGAEVILVENPRRLGLFRGGRTDNEHYNRQPNWYQVNRNKYCITLDLQDTTHREIFEDLLKSADVLVDNSRTGVMERLGYGYEQLCALKADLIVASLPAYGGSGPQAADPAYGAVLEAMSGIQNLTAYAPAERPHRVCEMDVVNGVGGACAILTALWNRRRSGRGQRVDLSQLELPTHALLGEHLLEYLANGEHDQPRGNRHRWFAPQGCYPCKGEDRWLTLTIRSQEEWRGLCRAIGRTEWAADVAYDTPAARHVRHDEIDAMIARWTRNLEHREAMRILQAHGVPAAAVLDMAELAEDQHLQQRGYFVANVAGTDKRLMGLAFRLGPDGKENIRWRGPDLGAHNQDIIGERLGRSDEEVPVVRPEEIGTAYDPE